VVLTPFGETSALMLAFKSHDGVAYGARVEYLTPTSLENTISESAKTIELFPAYPNPFNPATQIRFSIPESGSVQLTVHDILGREVAILVNGTLPAGEHQATFDATNLSSGIYLYRLQAGNQILTGKLMLVR
jgi:xylan 1,4-beta-xylosidase